MLSLAQLSPSLFKHISSFISKYLVILDNYLDNVLISILLYQDYCRKEEPNDKALLLWCLTSHKKSKDYLKEEISMKNHVWVWKEETREEGLLPEKKFCVEYKDKVDDNWKPINKAENNEICEKILCQTTNGVHSLGSINIDLECTNESILMRLVPLDDQQVPRPRNPSMIN